MLKGLPEKLDHEVIFLIAVALGVAAILSLITWGGKAMGLHGVSSVAQHP